MPATALQGLTSSEWTRLFPDTALGDAVDGAAVDRALDLLSRAGFDPVRTAQIRDRLLTAFKKTETARIQVASARASFEIVDKKYNQGMASQIEYLDARSALTSAEINETLIKYNFFIAQAEFERVTASYPLRGENPDK